MNGEAYRPRQAVKCNVHSTPRVDLLSGIEIGNWYVKLSRTYDLRILHIIGTSVSTIENIENMGMVLSQEYILNKATVRHLYNLFGSFQSQGPKI